MAVIFTKTMTIQLHFSKFSDPKISDWGFMMFEKKYTIVKSALIGELLYVSQLKSAKVSILILCVDDTINLLHLIGVDKEEFG